MNAREKTGYYLPEDAVLPEARGLLQPAEAGDYPLLAGWIRDFYIETLDAEPPPLKNINEYKQTAVAKDAAVLFVWRRAPGAPVSAMGMLAREKDGRRLNLIYTDKKNRRKGYGRALVAALCAVVRGEGRIPVLYAYKENTAAVALYRGLGFVEAT
jgi:predicted GNAT family acetyltransferase